MNLNYALGIESIHYQPSNLFDSLVAVFEEFKAEAAELGLTPSNCGGIFETKSARKLEKIIAEATGLKVLLSREIEHFGPAMIANYLVESHIFMQGIDPNDAFWRSYVKEAFKVSKTGQLSGSVDLKEAKVTGDFTKLTSLLAMPRGLLAFGQLFDQHYSAEETAAIALHEIGHAFVALEYLNRGTTTNQILADLAQAGIASEKYNYVVSQAGKNGKLSKNALEAIKQAKTEQEIVSIVYGAAIEDCVSQLGASVFDETSCEQLADQFCVRFGGGRYLVSGLSKLPGAVVKKGQSLRNSIRATLSFGILCLWPVSAWISFAFLLLCVLNTERDNTYGTFHSRLSRIRYELVNGLKLPGLSSVDRNRLMEDIQLVEHALSKEEEVPYSVAERIAYLIRPGYRAAHKYERLQRELEDLAANPLFVSASKLHVLADGKSA